MLPISSAVTMPGRCYLTSRAIAEQRPELALAFMRALAASVQEIIAGSVAPLVTRCAAAFDMQGLGPIEQSVAIVQWETENWLADGRPELLRNQDSGWQAGMTAMADAGLANVSPDTELYTNRFVAEVLPR